MNKYVVQGVLVVQGVQDDGSGMGSAAGGVVMNSLNSLNSLNCLKIHG
ncbi:MAG: hypothetical protein IKJ78_07605 [Bacteroidales bacterium]|nr:hypothetical protein [Bacteroidales bacterium]